MTPMADSAGDDAAGGRPLPLSGLKVLDLGRIYQGPWCGTLLALSGATVIKIEEPSGEPARRGAKGTMSVPFAILNSNKQAITINLKEARGRELFLDLVRQADVVIENYGAGTMDGLGVGPDVLLAANPRLVYAAATGYGVEGPDRDRLAMDITIQAHSGVMSVTGFPDQPPVKAGVAFVDFLGAVHLYSAVVTALYDRERTGQGRIVDVAMIDTIYPTLASNLSAFYRDGVAPRSGNGHGGGALVPYDVFPTSDGFIALIVVTEGHWLSLCDVLGAPELADDDRFRSNARRFHNVVDLDAIIGAWTSERTRDEVVALLGDAKIPVAAVRDVGEVVNDANLHERGALVRVDHPMAGEIVVPNTPLRFRGSAMAELRPSPALGADTRLVLSEWLGLDESALDALAADGVV
jgi:crotonobetainyl-CoA:carnitine CoA-transferase CaiB-like acyl-CoA transferase